MKIWVDAQLLMLTLPEALLQLNQGAMMIEIGSINN